MLAQANSVKAYAIAQRGLTNMATLSPVRVGVSRDQHIDMVSLSLWSGVRCSWFWQGMSWSAFLEERDLRLLRLSRFHDDRTAEISTLILQQKHAQLTTELA